MAAPLTYPLTIPQAADELGLSRQRVAVLCRQHGIGTPVGNQGLRLLSKADLDQLRSCRELKYARKA